MLGVCFRGGEKGGLYLAVLNASNEAAVHLFLTKKISFLQIEQIIWNELQNKEYERSYIPSLEERISVGNCIYAKIIKEYGEII